jgi:hypothetical protein
MIRLALAQPGTAVLSFDLCCATPVLPVATGRQCSAPRRLPPREVINAPRQQAASVQIAIASDAQLRHTSRGFLLWRFAYAGPTCPPRHHHGAAIRKPSQKRSFRLSRLGQRTRVHSGNPAFRRPSINSFEFSCPPRAIHADIVNVGSVSSRRAAASRASASRPRWAKADVRQR